MKNLVNKNCDFCGKLGKTIFSWGKRYCSDCYAKKPKKGKGHSGMLKSKYIKNKLEQTSLNAGLRLQPIEKGNKVFSTLYLEHYPASKGIIGRQLNYLIWNNNKIVGIIGCNSPPLNYLKFREYFKTDDEKMFMNNNVFRIINSGKNQATQILKLFRKTIINDYKKKYGIVLLGLITFVEPPRTGSIYKADNWDYLGMTKGITITRRGGFDAWQNKGYTKGIKKHIFAIKFDNNGKK
jgi:hypothetical protein